MDMNYVFINDNFVEAESASLQITDLAIQRGYGIFDFFKTINGQPLFLDDHLERFYHSAVKMHMQPAYPATELKEILRVLMEKNRLPDSGIRITLTGGYSADGYSQAEPNMLITQQPLELKMAMDTKGIRLVTYPHQRQLAEVKTLDYLMAIWLQSYIKEHDANDVLYHHNGWVKECPRANFFIVTANDEIITARQQVLKGVIRKNILNIAHSGLHILERDFDMEELKNAREAFMTSTTKHIMPVVNIDGQDLSDGKPGPVTTQLSELLLQKIRQQ